MNKFTVMGLPLPITSAILGYNLGWISPVAAQENSLFDLSLADIATENYLASNELKFPAIQEREASSDLAFSVSDFTSRAVFSLPQNDLAKFQETSGLFNENSGSSNSSRFYVFHTEKLLNQQAKLSFTTEDLENLNNTKSVTVLDSLVPWQNLDRSFADYPATSSENLELKNLDLNLATIQESNITNNIEEIPDFLSETEKVSPLKPEKRSNNEFNNNQALDLEQTHTSTPRINNSASNIIASDSFLVIDNLNTSHNRDLAATEMLDNPVNQTLAQIEQYNLQNQQDLDLEPITNVSALRDVQPTDWAYGALKKLVNRLRCFAGYEDRTFRGDRNISRYEFAAALNTCLQKMEAIAFEKLTEYFTEEAIAELEKLTQEFAQELNEVRTKTDNLENKVAFLEDTNFSPTTILRGEVVMQMVSAFGDKKAVPTGETPTENLDSVVTFGARTRLNFETSFTGRDLLRTRLEASNLSGYGLGVTGTQMTFLGVSSNTNNRVRIGQVFYRFPLGDKGNAYIAGARQSSSAFIPLLNSASTISLFGFNNPLYDLGFGAGGGVYYQFNDLIGAGATYYAGSPDNPELGKGFFNGDYAALAQVTLTPSDNFGISFTYAHFFTPVPRLTTNLTGFTGSLFAQLPFGLETATASDNFNISFSSQISDRFSLGGWVGYITTTAKSTPADRDFGSDTIFLLGASEGAKADIWTAALTASYNDIGKLGSKLSLVLGLPPKLTKNDVPDREDRDTSLHIELSYNYPLTEKISLTPGVLTITSPEHNDKNGAIVIGLMRTTFRF